MDRIRYSEKNYLCNYDLSLEFFDELGIKVNDVTPLRKVFLISTDEGNKILKRVNYDVDRVNLISDALEYIKKSYKNVISYNKLKNNLNYATWNDGIYVVMDILDGREASYCNPIEVDLCAKNIAFMHNASKGLREYLQNKYNKVFLDTSLKDKYAKAYDEILEMKSIVSKFRNKNEFDNLFIDNVDKYLEEIKIVQDHLEKSSYDKLRLQDEIISICHNDLAYHNFLIRNKNVNIIDFDYMTIDLRIMDVADFILKAIKNVGFDIDKMLSALNSYEEINVLEKEERKLLYIILEFPRDFHTIARDYYYKRKKWDYEVYLNRFKAKMNNEPFRHEFLDVYKNKINKD